MALEVSNILSKKGIDAKLISMHTIKPFDYACLDKLLNTDTPIFTIEEHSLIGGLGTVVAEYIAESKYNPIFKRFALPDEYSHYVGSQQFIRNKFALTSEKISLSIMETI